MALPFCVRLYKNVCLYYTRYADVDYIKIDFQRKNCLLESAFGLRILSGFVFGSSASMCGYTVLCVSHHAVVYWLLPPWTISMQAGSQLKSSPNEDHGENSKAEKGGAIVCDWAEAPMEQYLYAESPGTEHAGQYSCVTAARHEEVLLSKDLH